MADTKKIRSNYTHAVTEFKKTESVLAKALDALKAARAGDVPATITRTRLAARDAAKASGVAWEFAEKCRREFWRDMAAQQEAKIAEVVKPMLAELMTLRRFANLTFLSPFALIQQHTHDVHPATAVAEEFGDIEDEPLNSPQLRRADDEI